jgi:hypothetical protein
MRDHRPPRPARVILAVDHDHPSAPSADADPPGTDARPRLRRTPRLSSLDACFIARPINAAGPHPPVAAANDAKQDS